jgi:hypothetical protein
MTKRRKKFLVGRDAEPAGLLQAAQAQARIGKPLSMRMLELPRKNRNLTARRTFCRGRVFGAPCPGRFQSIPEVASDRH